MNRSAVDVHAGVARLAEFFCAKHFARLQATFNCLHCVAIGMPESLTPSHAPRYRGHFRSEHSILVLKIIDLEFLVISHASKISEAQTQATAREGSEGRLGSGKVHLEETTVVPTGCARAP